MPDPDTDSPIPDLEACVSFVAVNRLISDSFTAKAKNLLELTQSIENIDERMRIADLMQFSEKRAALHASIAHLQERDLGIKCHCSSMAKMKDRLDLRENP